MRLAPPRSPRAHGARAPQAKTDLDLADRSTRSCCSSPSPPSPPFPPPYFPLSALSLILFTGIGDAMKETTYSLLTASSRSSSPAFFVVLARPPQRPAGSMRCLDSNLSESLRRWPNPLPRILRRRAPAARSFTLTKPRAWVSAADLSPAGRRVPLILPSRFSCTSLALSHTICLSLRPFLHSTSPWPTLPSSSPPATISCHTRLVPDVFVDRRPSLLALRVAAVAFVPQPKRCSAPRWLLLSGADRGSRPCPLTSHARVCARASRLGAPSSFRSPSQPRASIAMVAGLCFSRCEQLPPLLQLRSFPRSILACRGYLELPLSFTTSISTSPVASATSIHPRGPGFVSWPTPFFARFSYYSALPLLGQPDPARDVFFFPQNVLAIFLSTTRFAE